VIRRLFPVLLLASTGATACAQADTITPPRQLFTWQDGLLAGAFAGMAYAAHPLDKHFAQRLQSPTAQENTFLQRTSTVVRTIAVPGSLVIGGSMYAAGRLSRSHRLADLGYHGTEALLVGEALGSVLKGIFGRERPYVHREDPNPDGWQLLRGFGHDDGYRSFPSGHAVAAFAAASAVTAEMSRWYPDGRWLVGSTMYGGAGLVAFSRMYNNRHWASDVLVGAAIGTFAGNKVVRYHHSHPGNKPDEWLVNFSVVPSGAGHALRASIFPRFRPAELRQR
jgi:membrane-associated phospholipid phosphatase